MGLQDNIQMINRPNTISTCLWPRSRRSTTFPTTNTYDSRYLTCRCRGRQEGLTDATKQTRRTPTTGYTTSRNLETTVEGLA